MNKPAKTRELVMPSKYAPMTADDVIYGGKKGETAFWVILGVGALAGGVMGSIFSNTIVHERMSTFARWGWRIGLTIGGGAVGTFVAGLPASFISE